MSGAADASFAHAVRAAATGNAAPLDEMLRSRTPLGDAERALIAELDSGVLRPVMGRGAALTAAQQRYCAARYIAGGATKAVLADLVDETGMDRATVLGWVRALRRGLRSAPDPQVIITQIIQQHERKQPARGE